MVGSSKASSANRDRAMKVLDLINTSESAKELLLGRALDLRARHGVEAHILCSPGAYVNPMREAGIVVHILDTPRTMRPFALTRSYLELIRLLRRERYDILHSHGSVLGLLTRLARPFTTAAIVHTVHGFHFHERMPRTRRILYRAAERLLAGRTDLILSQNREDLGVLRGWRLRGRVEWIGNGIPLPEVSFSYRAEAKAEYLLCCIARFEPVKNHRMLFDAFAGVLAAGVRARLVCFGAGELLGEMKGYVRDLGVLDSVDFRGYVDQVIPHLGDVDLHVLTSEKEGLPRALMETMAVGIPSVATDVKGTSEVVVDGVTGRLVPLGDAATFADTVAGLLRDPNQRSRMSRACMARAREQYDEASVSDRLARFYSTLREAHEAGEAGDVEICGKYSCSS